MGSTRKRLLHLQVQEAAELVRTHHAAYPLLLLGMRWKDCADDLRRVVRDLLEIPLATLEQMEYRIDRPPPTVSSEKEPDLVFALELDHHGIRPVLAPVYYYAE